MNTLQRAASRLASFLFGFLFLYCAYIIASGVHYELECEGERCGDTPSETFSSKNDCEKRIAEIKRPPWNPFRNRVDYGKTRFTCLRVIPFSRPIAESKRFFVDPATDFLKTTKVK